MADGSISGNSGKAVQESEETSWFYFSPSPTYFPSPPPDFPPSPPLEFPPSPPPPSSDSRPVLPLAFDGSQPPMEIPHQFTTNSLPLLPPPPQNQQQVISPAPQHQDNVSKQNLLTIEKAADAADTALQRVLEDITTTSNFSRRRRIMMNNRAAESTAPPRTEFPPPPAQQRNPEEDPGSGRSETMAAAVDNEVEGLGWGSGTGDGDRRKILERENKKTRGVRITIPLEDILNSSKMSLEDAAKNLNVSRSTLKRVCRGYEIPRWPPRSKIIRQNPQLNSNYLQRGPSNQAASSSIVVRTNQPQLSSAKKQSDTDANREMCLSSFKQPNDGNIVTVKARYVDGRTIKFWMPWPSSGLVEMEQNVAKRLDLDAGTYHIKYKDEEDELILIACDEDFQDYVCDARLKGTSSIAVFLEPKHAAN